MLLPLLLALSLPAAYALPWTATIGADLGVNDPYVVRRGARAAAELAPVDWFRVGASAAWYPNLDQADYTQATRDLLELNVAPDISRITAAGQLYGVVMPLHVTYRSVRTSIGAEAGVALVSTTDDLALIRAEDDPDFVATEHERHPAAVLGVRGEAVIGSTVLQVRVTRTSYRELVGGETREDKTPIFIGIDLGLRFSGRAAEP